MIQINDVTKKYASTVILERANYTFPQKGIVCLMGPSGGGKTTLLNLLAGFDTDYTGQILVGGTDIHAMQAEALCEYRKNNTGFVFQNYHLLSGYTVLENVMLPSELTAQSFEKSREKALALLARLGIAGKELQTVENLSGGQKQRVAIARALMSDPQIVFADEPTGALDRATSTEMMHLLQELAQQRLVVVITHDPKICEFADEIIQIKDKKIAVVRQGAPQREHETPLKQCAPTKVPIGAHAKKNFRVHLKRYIAVSIAISMGVLACLFSLSFGNVTQASIQDFQEKNTAFNNGYIKGEDDGTILKILKNDERVEHVYYQYKLNRLALSVDGKTETMQEKFPAPKTSEGISYGVLPRRGSNEVALTPSLAKKFTDTIDTLIGKELTLTFDNKQYSLTVSGIFNAGYDDFFVSADIEQKLYETLPTQKNYSISYDVKLFSDIVDVSDSFKARGISAQTAADEVLALQNTFQSLGKLFFVISVLIFMIGTFICAVLLFKLQNTRYHELGLLSALGFHQHQIIAMISVENVLLSALASVVNCILLGSGILLARLLHLPLIIAPIQIGASIIITFLMIVLLSWSASYHLVRTQPAEALRK